MVSKISEYAIMKSTFKISLIFYSIILMIGCAANHNNKLNNHQLKRQKQIPPGVDTLLAIRADSLSEMFFVDFTQKMKSVYFYNQSKKLFDMSDSLWILYKNLEDSTIFCTKEDSNLVLNFYRRCCDFLDPKDKRCRKDKMIFLDMKKVKSVSLALCRKAKMYADSARNANPFDLNSRINLIQIFILLGKLSDEKHYYQHSIKELKDFLVYEKSQHNIFCLLAECYYALSDWKNAYENFHQAQQVLEKLVVFNNLYSQPMKLDTIKLVYYLKQQGDAKAKMYEDKSALQLLEKALLLTHSPQKRRQIKNYIDWINWDDGNILAVEKRDEIYRLYNQGKYKKANKEFKKLLKIIKTQRIKDQINWRIATIDFEILNKKNDGIKRLFKVIKNISPYDSSSTIYLNDYGAMCYTLGMDYLEKKKYKIAYTYFNQATKINWKRRGECYFQLAQLSQSDSEETIKNCKQVFAYEDCLSPQLMNQTFRLLVDAYKKSGKFELARKYYRKFTKSSF